MDLSCFFFNKSHFTSIEIDETKLYPSEQTDTLLGCLYILKYGIIQYERNIHMNKDVYLSFKFECIDYINNNKKMIKIISPRKASSEYTTVLSSHTTIDIDTFLVLCNIYNIPISYIYNKCFYSTHYGNVLDNTMKIYILCKTFDNIKGTVSYHLEYINYNSINWDNMFHIKSVTNPLPDITKISKEQLMYILTTFGDNTQHTFNISTTKRHIYDSVNSLLKLI